MGSAGVWGAVHYFIAARYIRHDPPRRMIHEAVAQLRRGGIVLLFPEGTRTTRFPINPLVGSVASSPNMPKCRCKRW